MYNPDIHHRQSIRLREYDYSSGGAYFVTICSFQRETLFGEVVDGEMRLNDCGSIVWDVWQKLPERFPSAEMDNFIVMPNHFHGIVVLNDFVGVGLALPDSWFDKTETQSIELGAASGAPTLGDVIRAFKSITAVIVNRILERQGVPLWQRNYYEHVIRNEDDLAIIRQYIADNPQKWDLDENNPANVQKL